MKQSLVDLNSYLFTELDRLSNEDLTEEELQTEISRAKAITDVSEKVISNASLVLKAEELRYECMGRDFKMPKLLSSDSGENDK